MRIVVVTFVRSSLPTRSRELATVPRVALAAPFDEVPTVVIAP